MAREQSPKQPEVSAPEVMTQLAAIGRSKPFGGDRNETDPTRSAQVLEYIVTRTLNSRDTISGQDIQVDVFQKGGSHEGGTDAKVAVNKVRRLLAIYYRTIGTEDMVAISIPLGKYRADFRYRSGSFAQSEVKRGLLLVNLESPENVVDALVHFEAAIQAQESYADAYVGKAAALLTRTLHSFNESPVELFTQAEAAAKKARELNPHSWGACVHLGALSLFRHQWKLADREYSQAHKMRPLDLWMQGSFGPYLLCRGRYEEAKELIEFYRKKHSDNITFLRRASLYLYVLRRYEEAQKISVDLIKMRVQLWLAHLTLVFTGLATGDPHSALSNMRLASSYAGYEMWPGLHILCLVETGELLEANHRFVQLKEKASHGYVQPMQFALAFLALGQPQACVSQLSEACDVGDPFTAWLHLWPFLDPVRAYPEFQAFLRKWGFPEGVS